MGLTEDKIKEVLTAATNLAATGIMPLESAVKNIGKQFSGTAGEMGEVIPALKDLTAEQLRAGEGIALINKNFAGALETAASTLEGKTTQVSNVVGDIKEKIGGIFGAGKETILDAILPVLQRIDTWFENNQNKIINFFKNIPEIFQVIGDMLWEIIKKAFNIEYIFTVFKALGDYLWNTLKIIVTNLGPLFVEAFKEVINNVMYIQYRLAKLIDLIGATLMDTFMGVADSFINSIINGINKAIVAFNKLNPFADVASIENVSIATDKASGVKSSTGNYDEWKAADWSGSLKANPDVDIGSQLSKYFKDSIANTGSLFKALGEPFKDIFGTAKDKMDEILGRQVEAAKEVATTIQGTATTPPTIPEPEIAYEGTLASTGTASSTASTPPDLTWLEQLSEKMGGMSGVAGKLGDEMGGAAAGFAQAALTAGPMGLIMEALSYVFKGIMQVVGPIINSLLKPLIGILMIVGQTIGKILIPALGLLEPIMTLISKLFIFSYNYVIKPIANAVIFIFTAIYNAFAWLYNLLSKIIKGITLGLVNLGRMESKNYDDMKLQSINEGDLNAAGGEGTGGSGSSGGQSASYSAPRDINIYVNIEKSMIGDLRDIALVLRQEIASAEALGI